MKNITRQRNPNWRGGKMVPCPVCSTESWKKPSQINRGKLFCSRKCGYKGRISDFTGITGKNHPKWKGDKVSYFVLHKWIRRNKGKAKQCVLCKSEKSVEWANKSYLYKRNLEDWIELCKKCHVKTDMKNGWGKATEKYKL